MNCRKFETLINDLARASVMDAKARAGALAHAEGCARCARRLADERALTMGLRALSSSAATLEAPTRVESALLAAFREQKAAPATTVASAHGTVLPMPQRKASSWSWRAGAAIAATVLFAVSMGLFISQSRKAAEQPQRAGLTQRGEERAQTPATVDTNADDIARSSQDVPAELLLPSDREMREERPSMPYSVASYRTPATRGRRSAPRATSNGLFAPNGTARTVSAGSSAGETAEIATDFMPLTYDGGALAMDSGHIVRVELPRTALVSMGLPMNFERAGEPVKADVLLGDDGVARAIRFVR